MGKRVCHSKTVPLDSEHHKSLHERFGNEADFWEFHGLLKGRSMEAWLWSEAAKLWHERTGKWPMWHHLD